MTPQEVIKAFMHSLDTHGYGLKDSNDTDNAVSRSMLDKAIRDCSQYDGIDDAISKFISAAKSSTSADDFLTQCGIILNTNGNTDTGAITGSDANITVGDQTVGTGATKTNDTVVLEIANKYEADSDQTNGQTINTGKNDWIVQAAGGNDFINSEGYDSINSGAGDDQITASGKRVTVYGGEGNDTITIKSSVEYAEFGDLTSVDTLTIEGTFDVKTANDTNDGLVVKTNDGRTFVFKDLSKSDTKNVKVNSSELSILINGKSEDEYVTKSYNVGSGGSYYDSNAAIVDDDEAGREALGNPIDTSSVDTPIPNSLKSIKKSVGLRGRQTMSENLGSDGMAASGSVTINLDSVTTLRGSFYAAQGGGDAEFVNTSGSPTSGYIKVGAADSVFDKSFLKTVHYDDGDYLTFSQNGLTLRIIGQRTPIKDANGKVTSYSLTPITDSNIDDLDNNNDKKYQRVIIAALYKWWLKEAIQLHELSYGYGFDNDGVAVTQMDLFFEAGDPNSTTLAYVSTSQVDSAGLSRHLDLVINENYYNNITDYDAVNGEGKTGAGYLDRTLAHEFTHAMMSANINWFSKLPMFIKEGMAELTHGIDDERPERMRELINNAISHKDNDPNNTESYLSKFVNLALTTSSQVSGLNAGAHAGEYPYAAGYMFLRWLAKTAAVASNDANAKLPAGQLSANVTLLDKDQNYYITGTSTVTANATEASGVEVGSAASHVYTAKGIKQNITYEGQNAWQINDLSDEDTVNITNSANNTITGDGKAIKINLGSGADSLKISGQYATINVGDGLNTIYGNEVNNANSSLVAGKDADYIQYFGNNTTIESGGGNDTIQTSSDKNQSFIDKIYINGGSGNDSIYHSAVNSTILSGDGDDILNIVWSNQYSNSLDGGEGDDYIYASGDNHTLTGGSGNDTFAISENTHTKVVKITDLNQIDDVLLLRGEVDTVVKTEDGKGIIVTYNKIDENTGSKISTTINFDKTNADNLKNLTVKTLDANNYYVTSTLGKCLNPEAELFSWTEGERILLIDGGKNGTVKVDTKTLVNEVPQKIGQYYLTINYDNNRNVSFTVNKIDENGQAVEATDFEGTINLDVANYTDKGYNVGYHNFNLTGNRAYKFNINNYIGQYNSLHNITLIDGDLLKTATNHWAVNDSRFFMINNQRYKIPVSRIATFLGKTTGTGALIQSGTLTLNAQASTTDEDKTICNTITISETGGDDTTSDDTILTYTHTSEDKIVVAVDEGAVASITGLTAGAGITFSGALDAAFTINMLDEDSSSASMYSSYTITGASSITISNGEFTFNGQKFKVTAGDGITLTISENDINISNFNGTDAIEINGVTYSINNEILQRSSDQSNFAAEKYSGNTVKLSDLVKADNWQNNFSWTVTYTTATATTTATYGLKDGDTIITLKNLKSGTSADNGKIAGITIKGNKVVISTEALNEGLEITSENYTLELADDVTGKATKEPAKWTHTDDSDSATYTGEHTTAGWIVEGNKIVNAAASTAITFTLNGINSDINFDNDVVIDLNNKSVQLANNALTKKKVSIESGWTLTLANDVTTEATTSTAWSTQSGTATFNEHKNDYYTATSNEITYHEETDTEIIKITGLNPSATNDSFSLDEATNTITLKSDALNKVVDNEIEVTTGNDKYKLAIESKDDIATDYLETWNTSTDNASVTLNYKAAGKTAGYNLTDQNNVKITYVEASGGAEVTISGLNSALNDENIKNSVSLTGTEFKISANALAQKDVTLSGAANYSLALDSGIQGPTTITESKTINNGTLTFRAAGNEAGYTLEGSQKIKFTAEDKEDEITITGLNVNTQANDINLDGTTFKITSENLLTDNNVTLNDPNNKYFLGLAAEIKASEDYAAAWSADGTTLTYKAAGKTKGYKLSDDSKSIAYTAASGGEELAQITGLKNGVSTDDISFEDGVVTLKASALDNSNVAISGNYTLELANDVTKSTTNDGIWNIVEDNGNKTATLSATTTVGYKLINDSKGVEYISTQQIGTPILGISGLKGDATVDNDTNTISGITIKDNGTVIISSAAFNLGMKITNGNYTLELDKDVEGQSKNVEAGWSTEGSTATYNSAYITEGYAVENNEIVRLNGTTPTTFTLTGLKENLDVNSILNVDNNTVSFKDGGKVSDLIEKNGTLTLNNGATWANIETKSSNTNIEATDTKIDGAVIKISGKNVVSEGIVLDDNTNTTINYTAFKETKIDELLKVTLSEGSFGDSASATFDNNTLNIKLGTGANISDKATLIVNDSSTDGIMISKLTITKLSGDTNDYSITDPDTVSDATTLTYTINVVRPTWTVENNTITFISADRNTTYQFILTGISATANNNAAPTLSVTSNAEVVSIEVKTKDDNADFVKVANDTAANNAIALFGNNAITWPTSGYTADTNTSDGIIKYTKNAPVVTPPVTPPVEQTIIGWIISNGIASYGTIKNNAIYGTPTIKITGLSSKATTSDITLSNVTVKLKKNALGTDTVNISNGYSLALGDDVTISKRTAAAWSLNGTTATYKSEYTSEGYSLNNNQITYTKATTPDIINVTGVKSISGLSVNNKVVTIFSSALNNSNITVTNGYTLKLESNVQKVVTTEAGWSISGTTATYKSSSNTAGYRLSSDSKSVEYVAASGGETLITISGLKENANVNDIVINGNSVIIPATMVGATEATITGGSYTLVIEGSNTGDDSVEGGDSTPTIESGGSTTETIDGGSSTPTIEGGGSTEPIDGGSSTPTIEGGDTTETINGGSSTPTIKGGDTTETINGGSSTPTIKGGDTTETINSGTSTPTNPTISGGGNDTISTSTTTITNSSANKFELPSDVDNVDASSRTKAIIITGNSSSNVIVGGKGSDTIDGGKGNDTLTGGKGNDVFVYSSGDGNDVITDYSSGDKIRITNGKVDKVKVEGIDVILTIGSGSLTVKNARGQKLSIVNSAGKSLSTVVGSKSTLEITNDSDSTLEADSKTKVINASTRSESIEITGNKLSNSITGGKSSDTLIGGKGNDTLTGGAGKNVFIYTKGDGNDVITDYKAGSDKINISTGSITSSSIKGNDVILKIGNGTIRLKNAKGKGITVVDSDGKVTTKVYIDSETTSILTDSEKKTFKANSKLKTIDAFTRNESIKITGNSLANTIRGGFSADTIHGGSGNDSIFGNNGNDKLYGDNGKDELYGGSGDDKIYGGAGKDILNGGTGNDTLSGGKGNDTLTGGSGADVFVYANGGGKDVITDYSAGQDKIKLTSGKITGTSIKGSDLILKIGTGSLTLKNSKNKNITITDIRGKTSTLKYSTISTKTTTKRDFIENSTETLFTDNNYNTNDLSTILKGDSNIITDHKYDLTENLTELTQEDKFKTASLYNHGKNDK